MLSGARTGDFDLVLSRYPEAALEALSQLDASAVRVLNRPGKHWAFPHSAGPSFLRPMNGTLKRRGSVLLSGMVNMIWRLNVCPCLRAADAQDLYEHDRVPMSHRC